MTPWLDLVAALAAASALGAAVGAGRITGGTVLNSTPVVGWTVIVSATLALVLLVLGAVTARRERDVLAAQREQSASVGRAALVWISLVFAVITVIGMVVRLFGEPVVLSTVALVFGLVLLGIATATALAAQRDAKNGAAKGMLIPRRTGDPGKSARYEQLSASDDARDSAEAAIALTSDAVSADADAAYQAGIATLISRGGLPKTTVDRLRKADAVAARYDV